MRVVGHEVLVGVARVVRERADEGGGAGIDRRLHAPPGTRSPKGTMCGPPARVPSGSTMRAGRVGAGRCRTWPRKVGRQAEERHVVERRLAGHRRRDGRVVGGQLDLEAGGRRRVGDREAVDVVGLAAGRRPPATSSAGSQRRTVIGSRRTSSSPISRNRSRIHSLGPYVGGVAGPADALVEDLAGSSRRWRPGGDVVVDDRAVGRCRPRSGSGRGPRRRLRRRSAPSRSRTSRRRAPS